MASNEIEKIYRKNRKEWRSWLEKNHQSIPSVWLVQYKKSANKPTISWVEAVEEAICFGWIDSIRKSIDEERFIQFFTKRKPKSAWSKINKVKVLELIEAGLMTEAGYESITRAKENGSWIILDEVEELLIPNELDIEFNKKPEAKEFFLGLSKSVRKAILQWIAFAKRPETKAKRIEEVVELASRKLKPKQF
ncbi:YdeI/OmpD-associated family protein [Pedobacter agri]|uniref:YdeI/OmpD-associated family protein n=1 Tax=Pedobacter agri TaxID=454586 RepID=UPI00292FEFC9|nr:YdeI/OmpD-associated family protein [Pedobacter agri]